MKQTFFLTGTDTDVGKTLVSAALLQAANAAGLRTLGYKPVASGSEWQEGVLRNRDALILQRYSSVAVEYPRINPLTFEQPTSPHIASQREGREIRFTTLSAGLNTLQQDADWVLVEGAGGWLTPLSEQTLYADWVVQQQLPVILVVAMKLGCINHALLTQAAILQSGLPLVGWVANSVSPDPHEYQSYLAYLQQHLACPLLGEIPFIEPPMTIDQVGQFVTLP